MSYRAVLPRAFPFGLASAPEMIVDFIATLTRRTETHPDGSSFAVTVDGPGGTWILWMSAVSAERIAAQHTGAEFINAHEGMF